MIIWVFLIISITLENSASKEIPPNIDYIGRGYDIFLGSPMSNFVDTGFRAGIIDSTNTKSGGSTKYSLGKGVEAFDTLACQVSFSSSIITSASQYQSAVSSSASVDSSFSGSGYGVSASASFSYSKDSQSCASGMANSFKKYVYSSAFCEVYRAKLNRMEGHSISPTFAAAVKNLPTEMKTKEDKEMYFTFVKNYGTHIVNVISFGSKLTTKTTFTSEAWSKMSSSSSTVSVGASLAASADVWGVEVSASVAYKNSNSQSRSAASSFAKNSETKEVFSIGSRPPADGSASTWAASSALHPLPITYKLVSLVDYFWYDLQGKKHYLINDPKKRDLLKISVKTHFINLYNEFSKTDKLDKGKIYECPNGQIYKDEYSSNCVKMLWKYGTGGHYNWHAAQEMCKQWGGSLVKINNGEKFKFMNTRFTSKQIWLGGNKLKSGGEKWQWPDGSPVVYGSWHAGNEKAGGKWCMWILGSGYRLKYLSTQCHTGDASVICERAYIERPKPKFKAECKDGKIITDQNDKKRCVYIHKVVKDYYSARKFCRKWGSGFRGDLVSFGPDEKYATKVFNYAYSVTYQFVYKHAVNSYPNQLGWGWWIGLSDLSQEGNWRYVDGSYVGGFSWWRPGEPNGGVNENCVAMHGMRAKNLRWNDATCEAKYWPICEKYMN